ncbi:EamA-like transporter family protein [Palleronia marisminoris]|uniref:EamA-like transporter family protein n=1 Tax=Palleronia marisminoris TaxID=315423 RepID=A0A1Y5SMV2_9RHOB|nr:DMT family transporter [Palleronia marisminoris]SFG86141.1 EamA-like transporter family protein [Palleronia marisminoris]SLN42672.1 EamA-like transporter family protein [Palleronia marisminoris]
MTDNTNKGLALALIGALVIVPDTLFMRWSGLGAAQMVAWRGCLQAAVLLSLWIVLSRDRRRDLTALATPLGVLAALAQATNAALFATGIAVAPVAVVLFAVATVPLVAAVLGAVFLGDRAGRSTITAALVVLAGIGLSVSGSYGGAGSPLLGALCGGAVALSLAGSFTLFRARPDLSVFLTVGAGAAISGLTALTLVPSLWQSNGYVPAIWVTGLLILPISFTTMNMATRYTVAANVSLILLLETVLGPIVVWIGVGEPVGPRGLVGGAIVVLTLTVYLWNERRQAIRLARSA